MTSEEEWENLPDRPLTSEEEWEKLKTLLPNKYKLKRMNSQKSRMKNK